jgi:hypothetical protein
MPNPFVPVMPSFTELREGFMRVTKGAGAQFQTPPPPAPVNPEGETIPAPQDPQEEGRQRYLAYRGIETHGVIATDSTMVPDAEGYGPGTVDVVYDETPKGGATIDAEQLHAWRVNQLTAPAAGNPAQQIASRARNRTKLQIKNMSPTDGLWIGPAAELTAFNGYLIDAGDEVTLSSTEQVFALANGPNMVAVCVLTEFTQVA